LAVELLDSVGYEKFDDDLIVRLMVAQTQQEDSTFGVLLALEKGLPEERLDDILDGLSSAAAALGSENEIQSNYELTDLAFALITRRVVMGAVPAPRLWSWLLPFDAAFGYHRANREQLDVLLRENDALRQAVQHHVLLDLLGDKDPWQRNWRLLRRAPGFAPTSDDVIALLGALDPANHNDERWRDVVQLVRHDGPDGAEIRQAARPFTEHRPDLLKWLEKLASPDEPEWQAEQNKEREACRKAEGASR
jgi:hypothetical protein